MNNTYYNMNNKRCIRENGGLGSNPIIVRKLRAMRTIDELLRTPSPEIADRAKEAVEDLANTAFELAYPRTNESRNRSAIRMTESDLRNIVKESVNRVLTEMDWKTYRSAGDKAAQRGDKYRASDFYNYSNRKLEDKYGLHDRGEKEGTFINSDDGAYTEEGNFIPFGEFRHTPTTYVDNGEPFDERNLGDRVYGEPNDWDERDFEKVSPKQSAKINKAMGDMRAFDNGAYEYGTYRHYPFNRGWHHKGMIKK